MALCRYYCQISFMKCGVCKEQIFGEKRREHLKLHKLDDAFVHWLIENDDYLMSNVKHEVVNRVYNKSK